MKWMSMKVYIQEKKPHSCSQCDKRFERKITWMSMKEYIQEKNHTAAHNVTKGSSGKEMTETCREKYTYTLLCSVI